MNKTDKITNLYNKLVLYNNELYNVYGNSIFLIDDISFYKPRCVAFIDRYSHVFYYITLRRCNTSHTIMKWINTYNLSDEYYPEININEVHNYFKHVVCTPLYKGVFFDGPAILCVNSHDIAYTYYCTTNNNCIKCGMLNISLSNNIFRDVQNGSGCSYVFLYDPVLDRFCAVNETPSGVYQSDGLPNITGQVYTQNIAVDETPLDETPLDAHLMSNISIESFI